MKLNQKLEDLLQSADDLIENHGTVNPEILKDLEKHRAAIADAVRDGREQDALNTMQRLVLLIKFIFDTLPPPSF